MNSTLRHFWARLTWPFPPEKMEEESAETILLLPQGTGLDNLPVHYGSGSDFVDDPQTQDGTWAGDAEVDRPLTAYGDPGLSLESEKCLLLHPHQAHLEPTWPSICCTKYPMVLSNFLFSVLGLLILGIGVWGLIDKESLIAERIEHLGGDPMLLFVLVGLLMTTVSVSGCLGALRDNTCLLKFFTVAVTSFVMLQVLAGILLYTLRSQMKDSLESAMQVAIRRYRDDADMKFIMDEIQMGLECCGVESYQDWKLNLYFNCSSPGANACGVPPSCCIDPLQNGTVANSQCGFGALGAGEMVAQTFVYLGGCVPQLVRWINMNVGLIGTVAAILVVLEVMSLLLATRILGDIELMKSQR